MRSALRHLAGQAVAAIAPGRRHRDKLQDKVAALTTEIAALRQELAEKTRLLGGERPFVPNGHFYSPVHARHELKNDLGRVYPDRPSAPLDIDLNAAGQVALLKTLKQYLSDLPFQPERGTHRYGYKNGGYDYGDGSTLVAMLRHLRPKRLVEVGSGNSSCATLDTNELWLNNSIDCTFIEPYPELLLSMLKPGDRERITLHAQRVQDVDLDVFTKLQTGDVLFIDSTHVSRIGSDVNRLYFEILPRLAEGVYIHIHDVFYPFEYPEVWTLGEGRAWSEQYVLRALLQNSKAYEIVHFSDYLVGHHGDIVQECAPIMLKYRGGNIWLRKVAKPLTK